MLNDVKKYFINPFALAFNVEDNGTGFDVYQTLSGNDTVGGVGLPAMEERVRMLGGSL